MYAILTTSELTDMTDLTQFIRPKWERLTTSYEADWRETRLGFDGTFPVDTSWEWHFRWLICRRGWLSTMPAMINIDLPSGSAREANLPWCRYSWINIIDGRDLMFVWMHARLQSIHPALTWEEEVRSRTVCWQCCWWTMRGQTLWDLPPFDLCGTCYGVFFLIHVLNFGVFRTDLHLLEFQI